MDASFKLSPMDQIRKRTAIVQCLLERKGIHRFNIITGDQEASKSLPDGIYPYSGILLTDDGKLYQFWLDWDTTIGQYTLGEADGLWREVDVPSFLSKASPETRLAFVQARKQLALK